MKGIIKQFQADLSAARVMTVIDSPTLDEKEKSFVIFNFGKEFDSEGGHLGQRRLFRFISSFVVSHMRMSEETEYRIVRRKIQLSGNRERNELDFGHSFFGRKDKLWQKI